MSWIGTLHRARPGSASYAPQHHQYFNQSKQEQGEIDPNPQNKKKKNRARRWTLDCKCPGRSEGAWWTFCLWQQRWPRVPSCSRFLFCIQIKNKWSPCCHFCHVRCATETKLISLPPERALQTLQPSLCPVLCAKMIFWRCYKAMN